MKVLHYRGINHAHLWYLASLSTTLKCKIKLITMITISGTYIVGHKRLGLGQPPLYQNPMPH